MIRYSLRCDANHGFESWFANAATFETLAAAGQVTCTICGSSNVEKALMVPSVRSARKVEARAEKALEEKARAEKAREGGKAASTVPPQLSQQQSELETALANLRKQVEANSEYVGMNFAKEARRIHEGEAPERAIYGEAKPEEAKRLLEEGIPVAPLPFMPVRKVN